jgi:hypothetical protein
MDIAQARHYRSLYIEKYFYLYQQLKIADINTRLLDDVIEIVTMVQWEKFKSLLH